MDKLCACACCRTIRKIMIATVKAARPPAPRSMSVCFCQMARAALVSTATDMNNREMGEPVSGQQTILAANLADEASCTAIAVA